MVSIMATPPVTSTTNSNSRTPNSALTRSLLKEVFLHDWWLIKSDISVNGKQLGIGGFNSRERQGLRVFHSAPIVKRHDTVTVETSDGITVILCGLINTSRTLENGFISEAICKHFLFGFPYDWEEFSALSFGEFSLSKDDDLCNNHVVNIEDLPATAIQDLFLMSSSKFLNQNEEKTTQAASLSKRRAKKRKGKNVISEASGSVYEKKRNVDDFEATPRDKNEDKAVDNEEFEGIKESTKEMIDGDIINSIDQTLEATPRVKKKGKAGNNEEFDGSKKSTKGSVLRRSSRLQRSQNA